MPSYRIPRLNAQVKPRRDVASPYVEEARRRLRAGLVDPDALFTLAAWHATEGELRKALAILHRLTKRDPEYPGVWHLKAAVYRAMRDDRMADLCEETAGRHQRPREREDEGFLPVSLRRITAKVSSLAEH